MGARTRDDRFRNWGCDQVTINPGLLVSILSPLYSGDEIDETRYSLISFSTVSNSFRIERNMKRRDFVLDRPRG